MKLEHAVRSPADSGPKQTRARSGQAVTAFARIFRKRWLAAVILLGVVLGVSGCHSLGFYSQAAKGQYQLFTQRQSVQKVLAGERTPAELKQQLQLVEGLRRFAASELKLPVDGHYQNYVDVHRTFVVWNVEAAPEFSLEPKAWWYPLVGSLEYRGFFSENGARNYAKWLKSKGYDVYTGGVQAYSTLGWFKDPVLNTFIFEPEADLAETIFHELGHQRVFARGDTDFNEAFATTVGQEGARRWLRAKGATELSEKYEAGLRRTVQFAQLVQQTRQKLKTLYGDEFVEGDRVKATGHKHDVPRDELRRAKQCILDEMQADYARLKAQWGGDPEYDEWFTKPINNAKLNSVAAYYDLVPGFERLLALNGGDLEKFYQAATRLAKMPQDVRLQSLAAIPRD